MPRSVLRAALQHDRPIFCGQLSVDNALKAELGEIGERAEWHNVAPGTSIGQGYLLDLLRQRLPVDRVVLALAVSGNEHHEAFQMLPLDTLLAQARDIVEVLLVVSRGAEAVMEPGAGATMTIMLSGHGEAAISLTEGLTAFVTQFVQTEAKRWAEMGRSIHIERADSYE